MSRQLTFDLPQQVAMGIGDFFVSPANAQAHAMILDPARWPQGKLCLTGPAGAGKSHLARVFADRSAAQVLDGAAITPDTPRPPGATVIEDADHLPETAEEWLFHHHNALAGRAPLLLTARRDPSRWPTRLPDLASRMQATALARIDAPDDPLLVAVLLKLFADRQITPDPTLPAYLMSHIPRSFAALSDMVERLDRAALATRRPVTRQLAVDLLKARLPEMPPPRYD